jgi:hypothetical protein
VADLAEHLANQYELPEDEEERDRFVIDNDSKANWALRRLAGVQAEAARVREQAREQHALIDEWEERELDAIGRDERRFEGMLGDYWRRQLEPEVDRLMATGLTFDEAWSKIKTKSIKLAAGTLSAAKGRDSIVIEDDEDFVTWARENALYDVLNVTYRPAKDALAKYNRRDGSLVTPDGEKVPGVQVVSPGVQYKAKPSS